MRLLHTVLGTCFLVFTIVFGAWVVTRSSTIGNARTPASIPKTRYYDFSKLESRDRMTAVRKALLNGFRSYAETNRVGVSFGHFQVQGDDKQATDVCGYYDKIRVSFEAEGMATAGHRPLLTLEGPCVASDDGATTKPLWIPIDEIKNMNAGSMDFSFADAFQSVKIEYLGPEWPVHWVMTDLKLVKDGTGGRELTMDKRDIYDLARIPPVLPLRIH